MRFSKKAQNNNEQKHHDCCKNLNSGLWPPVASVIIKGMKSTALPKLITKVENFRQEIEDDQTFDSHVSIPSKSDLKLKKGGQ